MTNSGNSQSELAILIFIFKILVSSFNRVTLGLISKVDTLRLKHMTKGSNRKTVLTSSTSSSVKGPPKFSLPCIVYSCWLFLINIGGEGTVSLMVAVLPSIFDYLYDELDEVSDLTSPVQQLLTQAITNDNHTSPVQQLLTQAITNDNHTSPVQQLLTQAITNDNHSKRKSKKKSRIVK